MASDHLLRLRNQLENLPILKWECDSTRDATLRELLWVVSFSFEEIFKGDKLRSWIDLLSSLDDLCHIRFWHIFAYSAIGLMISADTFSLPERTLITMISHSFSFKGKLGESHTLYATAALAYQAIVYFIVE